MGWLIEQEQVKYFPLEIPNGVHVLPLSFTLQVLNTTTKFEDLFNKYAHMYLPHDGWRPAAIDNEGLADCFTTADNVAVTTDGSRLENFLHSDAPARAISYTHSCMVKHGRKFDLCYYGDVIHLSDHIVAHQAQCARQCSTDNIAILLYVPLSITWDQVVDVAGGVDLTKEQQIPFLTRKQGFLGLKPF